jgi:DNA-binding response OmpR family regulator
MSGRRLADRMRARHPTLRVLYMSGYPDEELSRHGVLEPGLHFIGKPFNAVELTRRAAEALEG